MSFPLPAALAGIAVLIGAISACHHEPPKAQMQAQQAAAAATAQAGLDKASAAAADRATQKTIRILVTAQEASHAVETAPGADAPVPPDVLARWSAGIDRVRDLDAAGGRAPAGHAADKPDPAVPAAE